MPKLDALCSVPLAEVTEEVSSSPSEVPTVLRMASGKIREPLYSRYLNVEINDTPIRAIQEFCEIMV
jgi:hypothetical protein